MFWKAKTSLMGAAACLSVLTGTSCVVAAVHPFSIPPEDLGLALQHFAKATNLQVIAASDLVAGKTSGGVAGNLSSQDALTAILAGSGLRAERVAGAYVIRRDYLAAADPGPPGDKDILVTGTRIHGEAPIGTPLIVIDRKAIEESGHATVADYIQTLPQNYSGGANEGNYGNNGAVSDNIAFGSSINLRGLGTESTLLLFDGGRPALGGSTGSFVDTSLIPTSAIDRIEILTDGASAIYGTDAVAGVVNVRFRDRYDGFETHLYNGVAGGGLHQEQVSQVAGKRWSNGGLVLAYQYDHRSRLSGDSRSFWTENLTRWGGPDNREPYAAPGTIMAANGEIFGIPAGQNGRDLTPADLQAGRTNVADQRRGVDILPKQTTQSVYAAADQDLTDSVSLYAHALYAHRAFDAASQPVSFTPYTVPTTNPFYVDPIGTDQPVTVQYDFARDAGHFETRGHLDAITTSGGLKARWGSWNFDLGGTYGHQNTKDDRFNGISARRVRIALAETDPATALNLFGNGTGNNPATIDFIRSDYRDFSKATAWSGALRADGSLFRLPAGDVKLAIGFEHRQERFSAGYYYNSTEADPSVYDLYQSSGTPGKRHIDAVYGELSIPVINTPDKAFPGKLDLSVAGRTDWYSDVGRTINPKVGLSWAAIPGVTVRSSWGTSFRAPTFYENAGPGGNYFYSYQAPDSHSPTGTTPVILIEGYSDHIRPEKSTTWTAGVDLKPVSIPGLTVSATYFDIAYRDRIAYPSDYLAQILSYPGLYASLIETPTPAQIAAIYASPQFINAFGIDASDIRYILHQEAQNLSRETVRGIDFTVAYSHALAGGSGAFDVTGTRLITLAQKITDSSPSSSLLDTIYNPVRWRFRGHAGWTQAGFNADAFVNYTSGYRNLLVTPAQSVKSWTTFDGQIGYRFDASSPLKGARIALSATNLLNTKPPYVDYELYNLTMAYDPNQASAVGREISVDLTFQW